MRSHLAIAVAVAVFAWVGVARAGNVTSNMDSNDPNDRTTLRYALTHLTAGASNTIDITAKGTISLNQGILPTIAADVTITGPGADQLTIDASLNGTVAVFTISGGAKVQISGLTITGGNTALGGGIDITDPASSLVLLDSVVSGNKSNGDGAAVYSNGALTIQRCTIMNNSTNAAGAPANAVYSAGTTLITDTTIGPNMVSGLAFQGNSASTTLTVDRVTIANNTATTGIGGFELRGGAATFSNSTFSGNTGQMGGDFWTSVNGVALSLVSVTANGGAAPALVFDHTQGSTVMLRNTIIAGSGIRCSGQPTSMGHNISSDSTCNLTGATDKASTDPMLAQLADNGGPTKTHALLFGSPAAGAGDNTNLDPHDQRGFTRVQFGTADIGALEVTEPMIMTQPISANVATGATLTVSVAAQNQNSTSALKFQWRKDGQAIAGATSATFSKASATADDSGTYDVQVINEGGALTSTSADINVTPGGGGGGCSIGGTGTGAAQTGGIALVLAAVLGYRRRRAASQRHTG